MVGGTGHPNINFAGRALAGVASIVVRGCLPDGGTCPVALPSSYLRRRAFFAGRSAIIKIFGLSGVRSVGSSTTLARQFIPSAASTRLSQSTCMDAAKRERNA